jgi:penicillin-binding protein 1A
MTLSNALTYSKNTITVRLATEIGIGRVAVTARRMGIRSPLDVVPSLALGTSPVTLLEMVNAYGTMLNEGRHVRPRLISRIETADGQVLQSFEPESQYGIPARDARTLTAMLRNAVERGTGTGLRAFGLDGQYAGKTGTTQRNADGWFIGMHPDLVAGAWVGFNDQRVRFRSSYWGQGGHNALLLVGDFFQRMRDRLPASSFPAPPEPLPPFEPPLADTLELDRFFVQQETESMADFDPYYAMEPPPAADPDIAPAYEELGYGPGGTYRPPPPAPDAYGDDQPAARPRQNEQPVPPPTRVPPRPVEPVAPPPADRGIGL